MSLQRKISASKNASKTYCSPGDKMDPADVRRHNEDISFECEEGDLVEFPREGVHAHWVVYIGRGKVIHLTGESAKTAKVQEDRFWDVVGDSVAKINNYLDRERDVLPTDEIIEKARSKLGTKRYDAASYNCEHFATWCRYGVEWSQQVENAKTIGVVATVVTGVAAAAAAAVRLAP
ncbi:phospholipase A and acyltransferase 4-like [Branchiostoma floridae]|uniref:Phospholipase A and acyltransferase 4-like n=1 Tax=Branchiostoma floridae TaxID=7739 RepID=A0A9J7MCH1_BRAFL|nr:phospholipase A and acyltransferase 4-like [Branchiostoma floridae]